MGILGQINEIAEKTKDVVAQGIQGAKEAVSNTWNRIFHTSQAVIPYNEDRVLTQPRNRFLDFFKDKYVYIRNPELRHYQNTFKMMEDKTNCRIINKKEVANMLRKRNEEFFKQNVKFIDSETTPTPTPTQLPTKTPRPRNTLTPLQRRLLKTLEGPRHTPEEEIRAKHGKLKNK